MKKETADISPIKTLTLDEYDRCRSEYEKTGLCAIQNGELALLLLAGGMGTRLGYDGPKGTYPIIEGGSIFGCLFRNLREDIGDIAVPFFVMTSDKNDEATRKFFQDNDYFGYDPSMIHFFRQEMAEAHDFNGELLYEGVNIPATSPNGNGGFFSSLIRAGYADLLNGVRWLNVFGVDNVLAKIADPAFLGAVIANHKSAAVKAVMKTDPSEKVGVVCEKNLHPSIVEYFELSEEQASERDSEGRLVYGAGVTVNYLFDVSVLMNTVDASMPVHKEKKKIPYLADTEGKPWKPGEKPGEMIHPDEPNGYKSEILITDIISYFPDFLPVEVRREEEFAPVKNLHGVDSVDSARELLKRKYR